MMKWKLPIRFCTCKRQSLLIPKRGYDSSKRQDKRKQLVENVADMVVRNLQHKVEKTSLLFANLDNRLWPDVFADYNFKQIWAHFRVQKPDLSDLSEAKWQFRDATNYSKSGILRFNAMIEEDFMDMCSTNPNWDNTESTLCVFLPTGGQGLLYQLNTMLCQAATFPFGRVPHFVIVPTFYTKKFFGVDRYTSQRFDKYFFNLFDIQLIEIPGESHLMRIVPRSDLFTDVVDHPVEVAVLYALARILWKSRTQKLIPKLETYFPNIGFTLIKAGFKMDTEIQELDITKIHLLLKLIKTYPDYNDDFARKILKHYTDSTKRKGPFK